ncbi:hypothetical protein M407DRAFT_245244 [Tulasnella calospora MUT 4182]|uniref:Uncharacterized protein n=1 Tax=Tulasnella calospora MUT 4182 TaxID=1051891 RepID=A0A0C3KLA0_9AGAM|nr:hypothetical protein M407DRAFT_245244 [Tulasnella calospora MUT 4182]
MRASRVGDVNGGSDDGGWSFDDTPPHPLDEVPPPLRISFPAFCDPFPRHSLAPLFRPSSPMETSSSPPDSLFGSVGCCSTRLAGEHLGRDEEGCRSRGTRDGDFTWDGGDFSRRFSGTGDGEQDATC